MLKELDLVTNLSVCWEKLPPADSDEQFDYKPWLLITKLATMALENISSIAKAKG